MSKEESQAASSGAAPMAEDQQSMSAEQKQLAPSGAAPMSEDQPLESEIRRLLREVPTFVKAPKDLQESVFALFENNMLTSEAALKEALLEDLQPLEKQLPVAVLSFLKKRGLWGGLPAPAGQGGPLGQGGGPSGSGGQNTGGTNDKNKVGGKRKDKDDNNPDKDKHTRNRLPEDNALVRFLFQLKDTVMENIETKEDVEATAEDSLDCSLLPISIPAELSVSQLTPKILIRECWANLYDSLCSAQYNVVFGNSGIGKSVFIVYVIWRIMQAYLANPITRPPSVSLLLDRETSYFLFDAGLTTGVRRMSHDDLLLGGYVNTDHDWMIFDSEQVPVVSCRMVGIASPTRVPAMRQFAKQGGTSRWIMPNWSDTEMHQLCTHISKTSWEIMSDRLAWFGGIPRSVLFDIRPAAPVIKDRLSRLPVEDLRIIMRSYSGATESPKEFDGTLLHFIADEQCRFKGMKFATSAVANLAYQQIWKNDRQQVKLFITSAKGDAFSAAFRGQLLECLLHETLSTSNTHSLNGVTLSKHADNLSPCLATFTVTAAIQFSNKQRALEIATAGLTPQTYYWPEIPNLPAFDSCVVDQDTLFLLQCTVSDTHGIKSAFFLQFCKAAVKKLPSIKKVKVVFVNTDNRMAGPQAFVTTKGAVSKTPVSIPGVSIEQAEVVFPLS